MLSLACEPPDDLLVLLDIFHKSKFRPTGAYFSQIKESVILISFYLEGTHAQVDSQMMIANQIFDEDRFSTICHWRDDRADQMANLAADRVIDREFLYLISLSIKPSEVQGYLEEQSSRFACGEFLNGIVWVKDNAPIPSSRPFIVYRAPTNWKTPERVFGKPTPAFELMRHIKRTLDPDNVFNPGRMF